MGTIFRERRTGLCALLLLASYPAVQAEPLRHVYVVRVDESLKRLAVEARFQEPVSDIRARSRNARNYIDDPRDCTSDRRLGTRGRRLVTNSSPGLECLSYKVDFDSAAREHRLNRSLTGDNVVVSPAYWLWRPDVDADTTIEIEFQLPAGMDVSVPWQRADRPGHVYAVSRSPESAYGPAVFGRFDYREIEVPGAKLRLTILRGRDDMDQDAIASWVRATATDVSLAYGRFPNPSPQVVIIPVGDSRRGRGSAVPFGRVIRDGGETVELLVNQHQPSTALFDDWTATHEFSHLMLPYVEPSHRWISEGFAQYYQNVLLTRSGAYDETFAWQKIHDGLGRGRSSRPDLSPNSAASERGRGSLMKMYWSGAAIALKADVELRRRSGGRQSLDSVLGKLQTCCLPSDRVWRGTELFDKLDELAGMAVFMPLYREHADTAGFPDTRNDFERLGLSVTNEQVRIVPGAELQSIRQAIMQTDEMTARWRQGLVEDVWGE